MQTVFCTAVVRATVVVETAVAAIGNAAIDTAVAADQITSTYQNFRLNNQRLSLSHIVGSWF